MTKTNPQEDIDPFDMICGDDISRIPETTKPDFECNKEKEAETETAEADTEETGEELMPVYTAHASFSITRTARMDFHETLTATKALI